MLDSNALLALALSPSERGLFAERCYASGCQALDNQQSQQAALLFALVLLSRPTDARAWLGLSHSAKELEHPEAAVGLGAIGEALAEQKAERVPEHTLLRRIWP